MDNKMFTILVSHPSKPESKNLTKDDVFGKFDEKTFKKLSNGMVIGNSNEICPIFKDKIPFKSVTVVCKESQQDEVIYWLEYVHGGNSVSKIKKLEDGKIAIRSDYRCW